MAKIKGSTVCQPLADTVEPGYNEQKAALSPYRYEVRFYSYEYEECS